MTRYTLNVVLKAQKRSVRECKANFNFLSKYKRRHISHGSWEDVYECNGQNVSVLEIEQESCDLCFYKMSYATVTVESRQSS